MDLGLIRGLITAILLVLFVGLWFWTWSSKRSSEFDAAAHLPLESDGQRPPREKNQEHKQ